MHFRNFTYGASLLQHNAAIPKCTKDIVFSLPVTILRYSYKSVFYPRYTACGRNNSHILKVNKNQTKQGTQKILLFIKSTYDANFFQILLKITYLKFRPLLMTNTWSRSRKLSMTLRVIAGGMAATSCRIASFNCSIVPGRRTSPWNYWTGTGIKGGNTTRSRCHSARDDPRSHGQLPWTASSVCHQ